MSAPLVMPSPAATVHIRDSHTGRTFCGRRIVAGTRLHRTNGQTATCEACLKRLDLAETTEGQMRMRNYLYTLAQAKRAYDIFTGNSDVPFEHLNLNQQQAWIGVVEFLRYEFAAEDEDL